MQAEAKLLLHNKTEVLLVTDMEKRPVEIKSLKEGGFVIIDDAPCTVTDIAISKSGKHGAAKARVTAVGMFDGIKRVVVKPGDARIDVPIIEKRAAQVISKPAPDRLQLMDLQDYSTFEAAAPEGIEVKEGDEVLVWRFGPHVMVKGKK
jgi:translation initiation factor 5A